MSHRSKPCGLLTANSTTELEQELELKQFQKLAVLQLATHHQWPWGLQDNLQNCGLLSHAGSKNHLLAGHQLAVAASLC